MTTTIFEVRPGQLATTRLVQAPDAPLADGQVRLRVHQFAFTANNITYAAFGDAMQYWQFYPSHEEGWGIVPVWGFAQVVQSLQSTSARELLAARGGAAPEGDPDSMVLVEGDRVWVRSDAVLRVCRHLPWPWRAAGVFLIVARALRDAVQRRIARNRYRWFGRHDACPVPDPAQARRFL